MNLHRPFQLGSFFKASALGRLALGFALVVATIQGLVVALSIASLRAGGVPADETSFVFVVPPGDTTAIRRFASFATPRALREITRDTTLHPHRIAGGLGDLDPETTLRLSAIEAGGERIVWSTRADASGRFLVTNVAHGRYRVDAVSPDQKVVARSEILEIGDGRLEAGVEWSRR